MSSTSGVFVRVRKYHPDAYRFVFAALQFTQEKLDRSLPVDSYDDAGQEDEGLQSGHITGGELLQGVREYALAEYGLLTRTVFSSWNIFETRDFGEIVFELVDRGEMRATENDRIEDFEGVYSFEQAFDSDYRISTSRFN